MSFTNNLISHTCSLLAGANMTTARMLINDVYRRDANLVMMAKISTSTAFFLTLSATHMHISSKNPLSKLITFAPLAITMGTFAIAQVAKKLGKYQEALFKFDKYSDRFVETALSVVSIASVVLLTSRINKSVSKTNLIDTGLSLAVYCTSIAFRIYCLVQTSIKPKLLEIKFSSEEITKMTSLFPESRS